MEAFSCCFFTTTKICQLSSTWDNETCGRFFKPPWQSTDSRELTLTTLPDIVFLSASSCINIFVFFFFEMRFFNICVNYSKQVVFRKTCIFTRLFRELSQTKTVQKFRKKKKEWPYEDQRFSFLDKQWYTHRGCLRLHFLQLPLVCQLVEDFLTLDCSKPLLLAFLLKLTRKKYFQFSTKIIFFNFHLPLEGMTFPRAGSFSSDFDSTGGVVPSNGFIESEAFSGAPQSHIFPKKIIFGVAKFYLLSWVWTCCPQGRRRGPLPQWKNWFWKQFLIFYAHDLPYR